MSSTKTKSNTPKQAERYPLGQFPQAVIVAIGKQIIHRLSVGISDITGDDFGGIFAKAIDGQHAMRPEGIADVTWNGCAWSVKTVKHKTPFDAKKIRLICGRNSPTYSHGVRDLLKDPNKTGRSVLTVWNKRVSQARYNSDNLRRVVLLRRIEELQFSVYEVEVGQYQTGNYEWRVNRNSNLEGVEKATGQHAFTWQPHGSQFTVIEHVPAGAMKFTILRPPMVELEAIMRTIGYNDGWVKIHSGV